MIYKKQQSSVTHMTASSTSPLFHAMRRDLVETAHRQKSCIAHDVTGEKYVEKRIKSLTNA